SIYPLALHDALPISGCARRHLRPLGRLRHRARRRDTRRRRRDRRIGTELGRRARIRGTLPAVGHPSVLLPGLCARHPARPGGGSDQVTGARRRPGPRPRRGHADGHLLPGRMSSGHCSPVRLLWAVTDRRRSEMLQLSENAAAALETIRASEGIPETHDTRLTAERGPTGDLAVRLEFVENALPEDGVAEQGGTQV